MYVILFIRYIDNFIKGNRMFQRMDEDRSINEVILFFL